MSKFPQEHRSPSSIEPATFSFKRQQSEAVTSENAAIYWYRFGFKVIPIWPSSKKTVPYWDLWLDSLCEDQINTHWRNHPYHEIGFIAGDGLIVLDADAPEAIKALACIEESHGIKPMMVVKTSKGLHHYFRRASGTFAKSDSHCTREHPERIDIKTGRAMVMLPPSTGKILVVNDAKNAGDLSAVDQAFIDSLFLMNSREVPRPPQTRPDPRPRSGSSDSNLESIAALLTDISPDIGYDDWLRALAAIFHESGGTEDGFALADAWSSAGRKYRGVRELLSKWQSFDLDHPRPCTIATLFWLVQQNGGNPTEILASLEPDFEVISEGGETL